LGDLLTSNVDNLLELYCAAKTGGRRIVKLADRASVGDHPGLISIYHLHGILDARGEAFLRKPPEAHSNDEWQKFDDGLLPDLVFRESEYYEAIANPVRFINHTPEAFLQRLNGLFIGTSLNDLNMRRWLYDSFHERTVHRAKYLREFYWRRYPDAEYEARLESKRHFWLYSEDELERQGLGASYKSHVESVMENFGVQVVWCDDYDHMARRIHELQYAGHSPQFGRRPAKFPD
jgi:SIR2-like domain